MVVKRLLRWVRGYCTWEVRYQGFGLCVGVMMDGLVGVVVERMNERT